MCELGCWMREGEAQLRRRVQKESTDMLGKNDAKTSMPYNGACAHGCEY